MVKRVLKFIAYLLFFLLALIVFLPKESLYYLAENQIKQFDIIVSNESVKEQVLSLKIENLELSLKGIESATMESMDIELLLLYNVIEIKNISLSSVVDDYLPSRIERAKLFYTPFNPFILKATGEGEFGSFHASFNIVERNVTLILLPTKMMQKKYKKLLKQFKKSKTGEYIYAKAL